MQFQLTILGFSFLNLGLLLIGYFYFHFARFLPCEKLKNWVIREYRMAKVSSKFDAMPHLIFKFSTYVTIACYATFFFRKSLCCPTSANLSSLFVNKRIAVRSNSLLKGSMGIIFFNCHILKQVVEKWYFLKFF